MFQLLTLLFCMCQLLSAIPCNNMVPGLDRQQRGLDMSTFDIFGPNPNFSPAPLLIFTCNEKRTVVIGGQTYSLPDQVLGEPEFLPYSQTEYIDTLNFNLFEYASELSQTTSSSYLFGMFSNSQSYQTSLQYANAQYRMIGTITSQVSSNEIYLLPIIPNISSSLLLDDQVCNPLAVSLSSTYPIFNTTSVGQYEEFLFYCGTHYMSVASFGGLLISTYYTQSQLLEQMTSTQIEAQAEANFMNFLIQTGGASGTIQTLNAAYVSSTINTLTTRGGTGSPSGPNTFTEWENTVQTNPWIWNVTAAPVSLLVPFNIQTSMNLAIQNHLSIAFLQDEVLPSCKIWQSTLSPLSLLPPCQYSGDCNSMQVCQDEWNAYNASALAQPWNCCAPEMPILCCCVPVVDSTTYDKAINNSKALLNQVNQLMNWCQTELQNSIVNQTSVDSISCQYETISSVMQSTVAPITCTRQWFWPVGGLPCGGSVPSNNTVVVAGFYGPSGLTQ